MLVWWNTSLSPPIAKRKADQEDLDFVVAQIRQLREETSFDVLALGEVCTADLDAIMTGLGESALAIHDATDRATKPMFDTAVIYDRDKLELNDSRSIVDMFGTKTLKTGELVQFRLTHSGELLDVLISHWPSRLSAPESSAVRAELGSALRGTLARRREEGATPYVILIGDYNDDPFSPSLANHLLATRDRVLARRDNRYLYNPFWRWIGQSHHGPDDENSVCGTLFYAGGETTKWFTYDQIIFSSAFLRDDAMVLNEPCCGILVPTELRQKLANRRQIFDHLPVLGTIELRSKI